MADRGTAPAAGEVGAVLAQVLEVARACDYAGYSKHDALNARWLEAIAGQSRLRRLAITQLVMRSPLHVRPWARVRTARNPKGIALLSRAMLLRHRLHGDESSRVEAAKLLNWLADHPSPGFDWACWGYPYPWQDVGFFAPRNFPNRVVTTNVVHALLDGYSALGDERYLDVAGQAIGFLLNAPRVLHEDDRHLCVSYVPSPDVTWIVMDVSALTGAAVARYAALSGRDDLLAPAARLIRYVVSKQTQYAAWYYAEPPSGSHITHDNYHTGFILDALLEYQRAAKSDEFADAYRRGLEFYRDRLFEPDGAPRFMSDRKYPFDIHGAAQGIITFSLAQGASGEGREMARKVLRWTLDNMFDPTTGWFDYQKRRLYVTRIRLLRWCQAWMAYAMARYLEHCGDD